MPDHLLPFLKPQDLQDGLNITLQVAAALLQETGSPYRGVMYGGFIATKNGVKLLEYNARFGDPEAMNVLPLLKTDFVEICRHVIAGTLNKLKIEFEHKATVCKYVVPKGYGLPADHPDAASSRAKINVGDVGGARLYYSSVDKKEDGLYLSSSRAIGIVGIADNLDDARKIAEEGVKAVQGPVAFRDDIGTRELIQKRIDHMKRLRAF
jgi:phosphoribosylamine--glycine ligase